MYTVGIEEEYFVFDAKTRRAVRRHDKKFFQLAHQKIGDRVMPEMLQSQIEVATGEAARERKLGIAAMGTFPLAFWPEQIATKKERYAALLDDLQIIGHRNMLCGMHVHVEVPKQDSPKRDNRVDLMMRVTAFLPLLLALSTSSPFWQGHLTGLSGYRLAAYDEMPRTGLPELFRTTEDYQQFVDALVWARIIPDASYIWWAIRPSLAHPTLELRIADSCTRIDDAVAIAALFRCLVRALDRDRDLNAGFDRVGRAITVENKWHAQRYGVQAVFVDPFSRSPLTTREWLDQVLDFVAEDVEALGCAADIRHLDRIIVNGTSADRQIDIFQKAKAAGRKRLTAIADVVDWVAAETLASGRIEAPAKAAAKA